MDVGSGGTSKIAHNKTDRLDRRSFELLVDRACRIRKLPSGSGRGLERSPDWKHQLCIDGVVTIGRSVENDNLDKFRPHQEDGRQQDDYTYHECQEDMTNGPRHRWNHDCVPECIQPLNRPCLDIAQGSKTPSPFM